MPNRKIVKVVLIRFLLVGLPLAVFLFWGLQISQVNRLNTVLSTIEKQQNNRVFFYEYNFKTLFTNFYEDLNLIKRSNEFDDYLTDNKKENRVQAENMFARFLFSKPSLYQLRFLDTEGNELIRADKTGNEIEIIQQEKLQNKKDRYYFKSIIQTGPEDLYVSDFDLNVENGKIIYPLIPTIRFGIPVYKNGEKLGYLIANVNGLEILNIFNEDAESSDVGIDVALISGEHLISLDKTDTAGFGLTIDDSKYDDSLYVKEIFRLIDKSLYSGQFEYGENHFLYKKIEVSAGSYDLKFDQKVGTWTIISRYNRDRYIKNSGHLLLKYPFLRVLILFSCLFVLLLIVISFSARESEHLLFLASGIISDLSHDGILITDTNRRVIYCNPLFENLFGYPLNEILGKKPGEFLNGKPHVKIVRRKGSDVVWEGNAWYHTKRDIHIQKFLRLRTVGSPGSPIAYYIGIYTEPKQDKKKLFKEDEDTSLINIHEDFLKFIDPKIMERFNGDGGKCAFIMIRIKDFFIIKNKLSDMEEADFENNIGEHLQKSVHSESIIFVPQSGYFILITHIFPENSVETVMEGIDRSLSEISFSDPSIDISYFSGIALSPDHGEDSEEVLTNAYIALEAVSRMKTVKYLIFDRNVYDTVRRHNLIKREINRAYEEDEFSVVYQPQNDVLTGEITGLEALVRWKSKRFGDIPPYVFVPVMEEDPNQIKRLGKHILVKVLKECKDLLPYVSERFRVSLNLSAQEFADTALIFDLTDTIAQSSFPANRICFEITETVLSDNLGKTNRIINLLHQQNITVAIDDFGTGYSSLGYIKKLRADKLKIDRLFIKDFPEKDDGSILKTIANLAHEIGIKTIVEGIETVEQRDFIALQNCQEYQGYISSKPVDIQAITKIIRENTPLKDKTGNE